jgi:hypothetical protein
MQVRDVRDAQFVLPGGNIRAAAVVCPPRRVLICGNNYLPQADSAADTSCGTPVQRAVVGR